MVILIISAVLAVIFLLMFAVPVSVKVEVGTGEKLRVRVFYFFKVFENKGKKKKEIEKTKTDKIKKEKPKEKTDIKETLNLIKTVAPILKEFSEKIYISEFKLFLSVAKEDAMETAVSYGVMNAEIYSALAVLKNFFKIKKENVFIHPDFKGDKNIYSLKIKISAKGFHVLSLAIKALKVFFKDINQKEERK